MNDEIDFPLFINAPPTAFTGNVDILIILENELTSYEYLIGQTHIE